MGSVKVLEESLARKIAAGEVIDRPLSVIRELLDNSIDAEATEISCHVEGGGIRRIRITDNGVGMTRDDLALSILPHATSKINAEEDLYHIKTLGFRGEALASIAACSRLEICTVKDNEGHRIVVHGNRVLTLEPAAVHKGTIVDSSDLFWSMPARRKFLKRTATESQLCRKHFIEKALPFNSITFRYFNDDRLDLFLPATDRKQRLVDIYSSEISGSLLKFARMERDGLAVELVAGLPGLHKKNRSLISIYVNNRRIDEYGLVQAVQYAYSPFIPGGLFPVCAVFLEIPCDEVDFNVHPSKREARFRDLQGIHHFLTQSLQELLIDEKRNIIPLKALDTTAIQKDWNFSPEIPAKNIPVPIGKISDGEASFSGNPYRQNTPFAFSVSETILSEKSVRMNYRYLGQFFRCYLAVEKEESLFLIDQHAAHERILFDRLTITPPVPQKLLVPLEVRWESDEEEILLTIEDIFERAGFQMKKMDNDGLWSIFAVPSVLSGKSGSGIEILKEALLDRKDIGRALFAGMACRAAVKEGDLLDDHTARDIIEEAFSLPEPRCPHGRPVWFRLSHVELDGLVGRVIT